jgi:hypothetical protein
MDYLKIDPLNGSLLQPDDVRFRVRVFCTSTHFDCGNQRHVSGRSAHTML